MSNNNEKWMGHPIKALGALAIVAGGFAGSVAFAQTAPAALAQGQTAPGVIQLTKEQEDALRRAMEVELKPQ